jgi:outer membrane receptor protein involved in Fe transport
MSHEFRIRRAVQRALLASLSTLVVPAMAQDAKPAATDVGEVIVTGSRIARPDLSSPSPITIVSQDFLRQKGTVNVEEVLNQLPQVVPGLGAQVNNGGDGTATVDLRGLGPTRTLALVNGRRFVPATNTGRIDLNAIPSQLIERIDVVTGGASAVYGSDAVAGVVNFVLKDNFEGIELGARYGNSEHGDAQNTDAYALLGGNFADNRGNATLAATYLQRHALFQDARDFSRIDKAGNGSATSIAGRLDDSPFNPFGESGNYAFNPDGSVRPFDNTLPDTNNGVGDRYNFSPTNYLVTPQKRYSLSGMAHYDLTDATRAYAELYYINNEQDVSLAPTPAVNLVLPVDNPLLSASARALLADRPDPTAPAIFRRRMVEFGNRQQTNDFNTTQGVLGLKGTIGTSQWDWDAYYSFGRTDSDVSISGDVSKSRLNASLAGCPTAGNPPLQLVPGCRVVDFFGPNKITPADVDFLRIAEATDRFRFDRHLAQLNVTGPFGTLPGGDIRWAFGYEYRDDTSQFTPSEASQHADLSGFNPTAPIAGGFHVRELYGEVSLPLLQDVPGARLLEAGAAARYSDYSTVGNLTTYTGRLEWKPVDSLRVRGTYSKASRAPSVFELFEAGDTSFPTVDDPCAQVLATGDEQDVPAAVQAICRLQGLSQGSLPAQSNSQIQTSLVGNAKLNEETAKSYTFGLVFQPDFVRNLSATIDYFHINVDNYVDRIGGGIVGEIANCFSSGVTTAAGYAADPNCSQLSRSDAGELLAVQPYVNAGSLLTSGFDFAVNYAFDLDQIGLPASAGRLTWRFDAQRLHSYDFSGREFAGLTSGDKGTLPKNRGNLRLVYDRGGFQSSLNWQYIGHVDEGNPGDPRDALVPHAPVSYIDLFARYSFTEKVELAAGVTNVFDKQPPIILTGFTATNTDNTTYDGIGRRYFLSTRVRF